MKKVILGLLVLSQILFAEKPSINKTIDYINNKYKAEKITLFDESISISFNEGTVTMLLKDSWSKSFAIDKVRFLINNYDKVKELEVICQKNKKCIKEINYLGKYTRHHQKALLVYDDDIDIYDVIRAKKAFENLQKNNTELF